MAPKRKRAEEDSAQVAEVNTSTRSSRSSARTAAKDANAAPATATVKPKVSKAKVASSSGAKKSKAAIAASTSAEKDVIPASEPEDDAPTPAPKKAKAVKGKAATSEKTKKTTKEKAETTSKTKAIKTAEDLQSTATNESAAKKHAASASVPAPAPPPPAPPKLKVQPYTRERALALFGKYSDPDSGGDAIGPEGFETLCTDGDIPLDGALPLIMAWQLGSTEMGCFTKAQWGQAMDELKITTLPSLKIALQDLSDLLFATKPALTTNLSSATISKKDKKSISSSASKSSFASPPYDRTKYTTYAKDPSAAFAQLYQYCFTLAKPEQSRNLEIETATAFWSVLLVPNYPIMEEMNEYIAGRPSIKAANKDLWQMMLEFCLTVDPDLSNFEADGAWPSLLDDFVAWKKAGKPPA